MKTIKYLVLSLVLAPCASVFGAEVTASEAKRQAAIRAMHNARNEQELKVALAAGAKVGDPWIVGDPDSYCEDTSLLCSVALNPKAHDDLISTVASMGGLTEWGTMQVAKDKNGVRRDITPIFFVLQRRVDRSDYQRNSLDLLQRKCKRLVDVGCPLAARLTWTIRAHNCPVQAHARGTFADRAMSELSSMSCIIKVPSIYKGRFMHTLAMCKATHDAAVKRSAELGCILSDTLPMFSLDIINFLIFPYVQAGELAEIAKLHEFITNHQVLPYLSELESETKAKVEMASAS